MDEWQLRVTLSGIRTAQLDEMRGPATRTAYAAWLLDRAIERELARQAKLAQQDQDGSDE